MLTERIPQSLQGLWKNLHLDTKFIAALVSVGLIAAVLTFAMLATVIVPRFSDLESDQVSSHLDRTKAALDEYSTRVETAVKDYAAWDDSYTYLERPDPSFASDTLSVLAMTNLDVNGMAYVRLDGSIVASNWVDVANGAQDPAMQRVFDTVVVHPALIALVSKKGSAKFYQRIGQRIVAICAARVVKTDGSGTPTGFVVMARELTSDQLSDFLQVHTRIAVNDRKPAQRIVEYGDRIDIAVDIPGLSGRVAQAKFSLPRHLSEMGYGTLLYAGACAVLVLAVVLMLLRRLLREIVVKRLYGIERHLARIAMTGELAPLVSKGSADEIGTLVHHLNDMLAQLKDLREQVEIQSFKLGKTESAVGVMHNVRNGLNPVSVILARAASNTTAVSITDVSRAMDELEHVDTRLERRIRLTAFLRAALGAQMELRRESLTEIATARQCLSEVVDMIGKQQALAHAEVETSVCEIGEIVAQNAALASYAKSLQVQFSVQDSKAVAKANRILLSQVVGNLFSNAVESITSAKRAQGVVDVSYVEHALWLEVRVRDNGEGFAPDQAKRFFERGYSTRKEKSGGLGLHWCANALNLMNGQLDLVSDGAGLGATAIIRLPLPEALPVEAEQQIADKGRQHPVAGNGVATQALRS